MNLILNKNLLTSNNPKLVDLAALIMRITVALIMFPHGAQKLFGWFGGAGIEGTIGFLNGVYHLPVFIVVMVILIESVGMVMLFLGLGTRPVALFTIILMIGAIVTGGHNKYFFMNWFGMQPIEGMEYHLLVIGLSFAIFILGPGRFSLDTFISKGSFVKTVALLAILSLAGCDKEEEVILDQVTQNKYLVTAFYTDVFINKNPDKIDQYIGETYIQHNPYLPDGKEALKGFLNGYFSTNPTLTMKIERVVAEGDLVVLHVSSKASVDAQPTAITDIFRVANGKIVEHWDVIQEVPTNSVHNNGMFAGADNSVKTNSNLENNKQLVRTLYEGIFNTKDLSLIDRYLAENYIQHNLQVADGREGFREFASYLTSAFPQMQVEIKRIVAENNFVVLHVHARFSPDDPGSAITDYYRIENGRIIEHWDVIQAIPPTSANTNTMF